MPSMKPIPFVTRPSLQTAYRVVGGPCDGQWVALPPGQRTWCAIIRIGQIDPLGASHVLDALERFDYKLMEFAGEEEIYSVLVPSTWGGDQALRELIEGYRVK